MKKVTFILAFLMATTLAKGQSYTEFYFDFGWYFQYMQDLAEMKDGNILTCTRLFNADSTGHYSGDYGYSFLKLNREDASIMDSVFLPDNYTSYFLFEPHPTNDGYLFIHQVYDSLTESNLLKIRCLHENLVFDDEITAPLIDTFVLGGGDQFLLEEECFIMISGRDEDDSWVCQRFGFDGTLKDRAVYPKSIHHCQFCTGIKVWNESPKEYVTWGYANGSTGSFYYHILDSLLNIKESVALEHTPGSNIWFGQNYDVLESLDEDNYLLATPYEAGYWNSPGYRAGAQITKCEKATHTNLKTVYFPFPVASSGVVGASPYVVDVRQTKEGYIYLSYGDISGMNRFSVVLLDSDLNVLWQQYYLNLEAYDMMYRMKVLSDGGVGIVGFNPSATKVFALFINNDYDALEEQGIIVRPYTYWPNPIQDKLHLQFSPDVTPTQIELYDLQGRLVKTQKNGLESLEMSGLPSGTYTMRVALEDGKVFSDKVVKK